MPRPKNREAKATGQYRLPSWQIEAVRIEAAKRRVDPCAVVAAILARRYRESDPARQPATA